MTQESLDILIQQLLHSSAKNTNAAQKLVKQFYTQKIQTNPSMSQDTNYVDTNLLREIVNNVLTLSESDMEGYIIPENIIPVSEVDSSHRRDSFCRPGVFSTSSRYFEKYQKNEEKYEYLLNCINKCVFKDILNPRQQRNLVFAMKPMTFVDETIIEQGDFGDKMYFIEKGEVNVYKDGMLIDTRGTGSLIGEIALLHQVRRTARVDAVGEVNTWVVTHDEYLAIKIVDDMYRMSIINKAMKDNEIKGTIVTKYLKKDEVIEQGQVFICANEGNIEIYNTIQKVTKGAILTEGRVVDEIEGAYIIADQQ